MNILHINTMDQGGAFEAAWRLVQGQNDWKDISSSLLVLFHGRQTNENIHRFTPGHTLVSRGQQTLRYHWLQFVQKKLLRNKPKLRYHFPQTAYRLQADPHLEQADLVHLHWIANFLDYPSFFKNVNKPIIWTLHDMNPFLGGVHYLLDFEQTKDAYEALEKQIKDTKIKALSSLTSEQLHIVCPSDWLRRESEKSDILGRFPHSTIPHGINLNIFRPKNQAQARRHLGLPLDKPLVLFVAHYTDETRKGMQCLLEALALVQSPSLELLVMGNSEVIPAPCNIHRLGYIHDLEQITQVYAACDFVVVPSLEDNLPNVVLEGMACGKAVVGFQTGGIPEMIEDSITGFLAKRGDRQDLAKRIQLCLQNLDETRKMGVRARERAESKHAQRVQAQMYLHVYEEMTKKLRNPNGNQTNNFKNFLTNQFFSA